MPASPSAIPLLQSAVKRPVVPPSEWGSSFSAARTNPSSEPVKPSIPSPESKKTVPCDAARVPALADIRLLASGGCYEEALAGCEKLLSEDKLNPLYYFYQGLILDHMGRQDAAERNLRQAMYLDRNFVLAHYYLGLFLQKRQDARGAARHFQNVLRLLARLNGNEPVDDGEEIRVEDLRKLTETHLEALHGL